MSARLKAKREQSVTERDLHQLATNMRCVSEDIEAGKFVDASRPSNALSA